MSDTGSSGDKAQQHDEVNLASPPPAAAPSEVENKPVTPAKRTPSKRISAVERAQRESEELVKTLGGSLDIEGGRKTRSSTRGTPSRSNVVATPPPAKKARATAGTTPRRGKGRKIDIASESEQTSPEKISTKLDAEAEPQPESKSKPEPAKSADESNAVDAAPKSEAEKIDEATPEANSTVPAAVEKQSPAKVEEKPEPMEVDSVSKNENETPIEPMEIADSPKETTEEPAAENSLEEKKSDESNKVVAASAATEAEEKKENSSAAEENKTPTVVVDKDKTTEVESKPVENSVGNNIEANNTEENATSLPTEEVCPTIPPPVAVAPVPVPVSAGNDHKAESNDFCEPKIASPPITANNDGATPQYCN